MIRYLKTLADRYSGNILPAILGSMFDKHGRARLVNEGAVLTSRGVMVLASVVTSAVTARILGPALRGDYFYVIATCAMLAQFVCLGFPSSNIYFAAKTPQHLRSMVAATLLLALAGCGVATVFFHAITTTAGMSNWRVAIGWPLTFALTTSVMLATSVPVILAGLQRYITMSILQIASSAIGVVLVLAVASSRPSVGAFASVVLVSALFSSASALAAAFHKARDGSGWLDRGFIRQWLVFSSRAVPSLVLAYLLTRGTVYSARASLEPEAFGVFTIAYQIFEALTNLPQTISMVVYPSIVREGTFEMKRFMRECLRAAGLCAVFGTLGITVILPLITVIFGRAYAGAGDMLIWYLPALVAYAVVAICNQFLSAMHFPMSVNAAWLVCATVTIGCSFEGGKLYGSIGVAGGTSLGWILASAVFLLVASREIVIRNSASTQRAQHG